MGIARIALLVGSTALLVLAGLATSHYRKATAFGPLFIQPFSLAVDSEENVYCGVESERVHKYSPDRSVLGAWSVDAQMRPFRIRVAADGSIEVATLAGKLIRFSNTGTTLSSLQDAQAYERFGSSHDSEVQTTSGVHYAIAEGAILRREKGQAESTVWIRAPGWTLRWIRTPVPLALLLVLGPIGMLASVVVGKSSGGNETGSVSGELNPSEGSGENRGTPH